MERPVKKNWILFLLPALLVAVSVCLLASYSGKGWQEVVLSLIPLFYAGIIGFLVWVVRNVPGESSLGKPGTGR